MEVKKFQCWAIVELMGHQRIAGFVEEAPIGGSSMIIIRVPKTKKNQAWDRIVNVNAIYAINPVSEEIARFTAEQIEVAPISEYGVNQLLEWRKENPLQISEARQEVHEEYDF